MVSLLWWWWNGNRLDKNKYGNWYHLDANGAMETGWIIMNDDWYYFYPAGNSSRCTTEGAMAVNTVINGYVVAPDGVYNEAYQRGI